MSLGLRQEAFSLLNKLCQDSLEVPLALISSIHSRALDETLSHEERLLAIERLTRVRP